MSNVETITSVRALEDKYGSIEETFNSSTHMPLKLREEIDKVIEAYLRNHYGPKYVTHIWKIRTQTFLD
jgi:hypothetical protein